MSVKHKIQIGIIGAGMIGLEHIRGFRVIPRCAATAIADVNLESIERAAVEYEIPNTFNNYKDLLALEELDAVVVCVPPFLHEDVVLAALNAGKHVLCEKPMAVSIASAQKMVKRAKKNGLILASCSSRFRFSPTVMKAKEVIDSGALGEIYHIYLSGISRRHRPGIDYHHSAKWSLEKSKAGGGALLDWGIYDMNILFGLIDELEVKRVDGFCFQGVDEPALDQGVKFDVEEHGAAMLRCNKGLNVFWERAWAAHMNRRTRIRLYGSRGGLAFDPLAWPQDIFFEIYEDRSGKPVTIAPDTHFEKWNINLCVAQDFVEAIQKNRPPKTTGEEVIKFLKVINAVYRSNQKETSMSV